jgi:hypothetical protein
VGGGHFLFGTKPGSTLLFAATVVEDAQGDPGVLVGPLVDSRAFSGGRRWGRKTFQLRAASEPPAWIDEVFGARKRSFGFQVETLAEGDQVPSRGTSFAIFGPPHHGVARESTRVLLAGEEMWREARLHLRADPPDDPQIQWLRSANYNCASGHPGGSDVVIAHSPAPEGGRPRELHVAWAGCTEGSLSALFTCLVAVGWR